MYAHMEIVKRNASWPYEGPQGYRAAFAGEAENWQNIPEAIQVTAGHEPYECSGDGEGGECACTDVYVPADRIPVEDCTAEFGEHEHSDECAITLGLMDSASDYDDTDYSDWYGGERGYNDGLRWSDFV